MIIDTTIIGKGFVLDEEVGISDKIFILNQHEVYAFVPEEQRIINETWWLMNVFTGYNHGRAAIVGLDEKMDTTGKRISVETGVRPTMWIDISNI